MTGRKTEMRNSKIAIQDPADLRTIGQAMEALKCSRGTVYKLVKKNRLELVRFEPFGIYRGVRITARSLDKLIKKVDAA
jgi:excisionase family DNA binding protein